MAALNDPNLPAPTPPEGRSRAVRIGLAAASLLGVLAIVALATQWPRLTERVRAAGPRAVAAAATAATGTSIPTVAVLPFANVGGDASTDYLSDGMADELAHALARVSGLRVAGRASSYAYRGQSATASDIGRALGVAGVVEGSVRRTGNRLRVLAKLTSALDDQVLWDSAYESASADVFALQDSVTRAIVVAMQPTLRGAAADTVAESSRGTHDPVAYDLYLKGQHSSANVPRAIDYFKQAVARDPRFARAHAGLAMAHGTRDRSNPDDSSGTLTAASAHRAAALDPSLADAQVALGISFDDALHLADAEGHYRAAVALDAASMTAHQRLGELLVSRGRTAEGIEELQIAHRLDPAATAVTYGLGAAQSFGRQYADARLTVDSALARDSASTVGRYLLGLTLVFDGHADSTAHVFENTLRRDPTAAGARGALVLAYAAANRWRDAERVRATLRRGNDRSDGTERAFAELVFGDREPAIRLLGTDVGRRTWHRALGAFGCNPLLDPLRSDQRFVAAMTEIGVSPCELARPWPISRRP